MNFSVLEHSLGQNTLHPLPGTPFNFLNSKVSVHFSNNAVVEGPAFFSSSSSAGGGTKSDESGSVEDVLSFASPCGAWPIFASSGGSGAFGSLGSGSLVHGEIHYLSSAVFFKIGVLGPPFSLI